MGKYLIGQNHLDTIGGSETYTYTLIKGLKEMGHEVELITGSNRLGVMSGRIIKEFNIIPNKLTYNYDLCLINHNSTIKKLKSLINNLSNEKIIQIIHGITPSLEQPYVDENLRYVVISNEIQDFLQNKYKLKSNYISNFVDLNEFKFTEPSKTLKNVLSLSQSNTFNDMLKVICKKLELNIVTLNKFKNAKLNIVNDIINSDLVFSLGRGCYESMSCGKNVIIADHRPYQKSISDGILTKSNYDNYHYNNCSGRYNKLETTEELLINEINKYNYQNSLDLRKIAEDKLDMFKNIEKMINI